MGLMSKNGTLPFRDGPPTLVSEARYHSSVNSGCLFLVGKKHAVSKVEFKPGEVGADMNNTVHAANRSSTLCHDLEFVSEGTLLTTKFHIECTVDLEGIDGFVGVGVEPKGVTVGRGVGVGVVRSGVGLGSGAL